jgi:hypothetical protein
MEESNEVLKWRPATSKNRELMKWLMLGEEEGEKSIHARTCSPSWWFKPRLQVGLLIPVGATNRY